MELPSKQHMSKAGSAYSSFHWIQWIFYNFTADRFHSSVCNIWQHWSASSGLRVWQHWNIPRHTFCLLCCNTPAHPTHRSKKQRYLFLKGAFTHISPRKGAQQLVLLPRISLGSYKIKDNLQLAAGQETPLKEFSAGRPDAEFADRLSALLLGLGGQGLLQRQPDGLGKEKQSFFPMPAREEREKAFLFISSRTSRCVAVLQSFYISMTK